MTDMDRLCEAGDYVVPNVLSPRDLVSRPDNMDETVSHISFAFSTLKLYQPLYGQQITHVHPSKTPVSLEI